MSIEFHNDYWLPTTTMNYLINGCYDGLTLSDILLTNAFLDELYDCYQYDINLIFDIQKDKETHEYIKDFKPFPDIVGFLACECYLVNVYVGRSNNLNLIEQSINNINNNNQ